MKHGIIFLLYFLAAAGLPGSLIAQDSPALSVSEIVVCTGVEDRRPVGADSTFAAGVEQLYCLTTVAGAPDTVTVLHVWIHNGEERATVELKIRSDPWRTWSSKRILPEWTGDWTVSVRTAAGAEFGRATFKVGP